MKTIPHPIHLVTFQVQRSSSTNEYNQAEQANADILCYPDTFLNAFQIIATGEFEYLIFDMAGNELEKGAGRERAEVGERLKTGFYMVQIKNTTKNKFMRLEKN